MKREIVAPSQEADKTVVFVDGEKMKNVLSVRWDDETMQGVVKFIPEEENGWLRTTDDGRQFVKEERAGTIRLEGL